MLPSRQNCRMMGSNVKRPCFTALERRLDSLPGSAIFWLTFSMAIIDRLHLLMRVGFVFTDSDQVIFWAGGRDYSHGIFHEPCVYGQNYNYMLESLLAAPFLRLGIAPWLAFPVVTSLLALAPYLAFAFYYRRHDLAAACAFAAIPVLLPTEFGMLTTASRGLVTGLFLVTLFPFIYSLKRSALSFLLAGSIAGLAFVLNPNSLPVFMVLVLAIQLHHARSWRAWLYPILGVMPFVALNNLVAIYYAKHTPIHALSPAMLVFHPEILGRSLKHLDSHFAWLCPVFWPCGFLALPLLVTIMVLLAGKRRLPEAVALLACGVLILHSLGLPKIEDGSNWVSYASSRMFLAVPLLLGIAFSFCSDLIKKPRAFSCWLLLVSIAVFSVKLSTIGASLQRQEAAPLPVVELRRIDEIGRVCARIDALCRNKADLIVALPPINCTYADASFYCLAGEMMFPDYPRTLIYGFERRSWRAEMEGTNVSPNILFIGGSRLGWQLAAGPDITDCGDEKTVIHLVHNANALTLPQLVRKLKPVTR
ncbi:MAG: hypothetical protein ACLQU4_04650 [Limisphaerales bacterium]